MPTYAYKETSPRRTTRAPMPAPQGVVSPTAQARIVKEARRLFRAQLKQATVKLPKPASDMTLHAFETAMLELLSNLSAANSVLGKILMEEGKQSRRQPTPRLRRAIAATEQIEAPRFANANELFASLEKRAEK